MIVARMGYAESSYASFLVFRNRSEEAFESRIEALGNLAHCFLNKYLDEYGGRVFPKDCCIKFRERSEPDDERCPKCGSSLKGPPLDLERVAGFIGGHLIQPMDGYGDSLSDLGAWDEFVGVKDIHEVPLEEILVLNPYAERIIPLALKGDEFDGPEHRHHRVASKLHQGVEEYWAGHGWIEQDPKDREHLAKILEKHG